MRSPEEEGGVEALKPVRLSPEDYDELGIEYDEIKFDDEEEEDSSQGFNQGFSQGFRGGFGGGRQFAQQRQVYRDSTRDFLVNMYRKKKMITRRAIAVEISGVYEEEEILPFFAPCFAYHALEFLGSKLPEESMEERAERAAIGAALDHLDRLAEQLKTEGKLQSCGGVPIC